jgi:hypothetical protein
VNLSANRHRLTVTGVAGIGYTLSWIAGLSVPAPSPKLTASRGRDRHRASQPRIFKIAPGAVWP